MTKRVLLKIDGMSCGHCVRGVEQALGGIAGIDVEQVAVGAATIAYDPGIVDPDRIKSAILEEGYAVRSMESAP